MTGWQGGYEPRGPQRHEGEHRGADRRGSPRRVCEDCGTVFFNLHAHLEQCPGKVRRELPKPCEVLVATGGFGVRVPCSLLKGHRGPHR